MLLFVPAIIFGFLTGALIALLLGGRGVVGWAILVCVAYIWMAFEEYRGTGYTPFDYSPHGRPTGWGDLMLEQIPGMVVGICLSVGAAYALISSIKKLPHQRRNNCDE